MSYCLGSNKAKINIFIGAKLTETINFDNPPININLQHGQTAQIQGEGLNSVTCGGLGNYAIREYNAYVALIPFSYRNPNVGNYCPGLKFLQNDIWVNPDNDVYYPGTAKIIRQYSTDWILSASNNQGQTITRIYLTEPKFIVSCDDDCPEGFCKCIIPEYPGYCCLDCGSAAASIRSITNELRAKNG